MEEIKPLVLWSNLFGLAPLGHQTNGRKLVLFLWCCVVFAFQLADCILMFRDLHRWILTMKGPVEILSILTILVRHVFAMILNFVPRLIWLRSRHLRSFCTVIQEFDGLSGKVDQRFVLSKRIFIAFSIGITWVLTELGLSIHFSPVPSGLLDKILFWLVTVIRVVSYAHLIFTYASIYALVLVLSARIEVLIQCFNQTVSVVESADCRMFLPVSQYKKGRTDKFWPIQDLLTRIHRASKHYNHVYSPVVLSILVVKLIAITVLLYRCLLYLLHLVQATGKPAGVSSAQLIFFVMVFVDILVVMLISFSADIPVLKMQKMNNLIASFNTTPLSVEDKVDINILLKKTEPSRVRLMAGGLFGVGKHLIPALMGTIATYIVILLQAGEPSTKDQLSCSNNTIS